MKASKRNGIDFFWGGGGDGKDAQQGACGVCGAVGGVSCAGAAAPRRTTAAAGNSPAGDRIILCVEDKANGPV